MESTLERVTEVSLVVGVERPIDGLMARHDTYLTSCNVGQFYLDHENKRKNLMLKPAIRPWGGTLQDVTVVKY